MTGTVLSQSRQRRLLDSEHPRGSRGPQGPVRVGLSSAAEVMGLQAQDMHLGRSFYLPGAVAPPGTSSPAKGVPCGPAQWWGGSRGRGGMTSVSAKEAEITGRPKGAASSY